MRKLLFVLTWCFLVTMAQAGTMVIDSEIPKDITAEGTGYSLWDGMFVNVPEITLPVIKCINGILRMESTNSRWGGSESPYGPFVYVNVMGDFSVEVEVTDYTYLSSAGEDGWLYNNDGGLMVRVPNTDPYLEDNIQNCFFPIWWCGNFLRANDDGARDEIETPNNAWDAGRFLKITKVGNAFYAYYSTDGKDWIEYNSSPLIRDDLNNITLQVGLFHATWSDALGGYIEYDNFKITKETEGSTSGNLIVKEGNGSSNLSVVLDRAPTSDVIVTLDPNGNPDVNLDMASLTFTSENWNEPQIISVSAVQDDEIEPVEAAIISYALTSSDTSFNGGLIFPTEVKIIDDDGANFVFSTEPVSVQEGQSVAYSVSLLKAPTADVIAIPDDPSDPNRLEFDPPTLTFTPENALTPQTITVSAIDNDVVGPDPRNIVVTYHATSDDLEYNELAVTLVHKVLENDCGAWGYLDLDSNHDCIIDLEDFAALANIWLYCTYPNDPACVDVR